MWIIITLIAIVLALRFLAGLAPDEQGRRVVKEDNDKRKNK